MKQVAVCIPKGRPWVNGFVLSMLGIASFESHNPDIQLNFFVKNQPFLVGEHDVSKYKRIAEARTELVEMALAAKMDYVWFVDDDMELPLDSVSRLFAHDKDYVTGVGFMKKFPYFPTIFTSKTFRNKVTNVIRHIYLHYFDYPKNLFEIEGSGLYNALIKTSVFEKIRKPWFSTPEADTASHIGEDVSFCRRLWESGIKMYCDPTIQSGHVIFDKDGKDTGTEVIEADFFNALTQLAPDKLEQYKQGLLTEEIL
jgi:hypothetical protein